MAVDPQTAVTQTSVGNREDLSDLIVRRYADEMPVQALASKKKAKAVDHDWLVADIRKGVLGNAQPEGATARRTAAKKRKRLRNKCQIFTEGGSVSKTQEAVDSAGVSSEMREQRKMKLIEIGLDKEITYCSAQEFREEIGTDVGEGRMCSGIQCFATTPNHSSRGVGGADGTIDSNGYSTAPTAGTNRLFTENMLKDVNREMYKNGVGGSKTALMGAEQKEVFGGFVGLAPHRRPITGHSRAVIIAAADVYVSHHGTITAMAHQSAFENECMVLSDKIVHISVLRKTKRQKLSETGDSDEFALCGEETLCVSNPKGIGIIADLSVPA